MLYKPASVSKMYVIGVYYACTACAAFLRL